MTEQEWQVSTDLWAMLAEIGGYLKTYGSGQGPSFRASDRKLRLFCCACSRRWPRAGRYDFAVNESADGPALEFAERWAEAGAPGGTMVPRYRGDGLGWCLDPDAARGARDWVRCLSGGGDTTAEAASALRDLVGNPFRPVTLPPGKKPCAACNGGGLGPGQTMVRRGGPWPGGIGPAYDPFGGTCKKCHGVGSEPTPCPWLTPDVMAVAQVAYEERPPDGDGLLRCVNLAVLADALEESGCPTLWCMTCDREPKRTRCEYTICVECDGWIEPHPLLTHLRNAGLHYRGCWALDLVLDKS